MRRVCHLGLGILGDGEDRWTAGQSGGPWGDLGMLQQPDLPMHPRNVGEEESEEAKAREDMAGSSLDCPLTECSWEPCSPQSAPRLRALALTILPTILPELCFPHRIL